MRQYKSFLTPLFKEYQKWREQIGTWSNTIKPLLLAFDSHCDQYEVPPNSLLTQEMVNTWFTKRETETNNSCRARTNPAKGFLEYLIKRNKTDIFIPDLPKWEKVTYVPEMLTEDETKRFFNVCDSIESNGSLLQEQRKHTIPVIYRLLYSTGLRPYEARLLRIEDVDLKEGVVNVKKTKRGIQHNVVLCDSMKNLLIKYDELIQKLIPDRKYFFPGFRGSECLTSKWLNYTLKDMVKQAGISKKVVPYFFRHNYATENLNSVDGNDCEAFKKIVMISKSMGHSSLKSTKYYFREVPQYFDTIANKTNDGMDMLIPDCEVIDIGEN